MVKLLQNPLQARGTGILPVFRPWAGRPCHGRICRTPCSQARGTGILPVFRPWAGRPCHGRICRSPCSQARGTGILPVFRPWAGRPCHDGFARASGGWWLWWLLLCRELYQSPDHRTRRSGATRMAGQSRGGSGAGRFTSHPRPRLPPVLPVLPCLPVLPVAGAPYPPPCHITAPASQHAAGTPRVPRWRAGVAPLLPAPPRYTRHAVCLLSLCPRVPLRRLRYLPLFPPNSSTCSLLA